MRASFSRLSSAARLATLCLAVMACGSTEQRAAVGEGDDPPNDESAETLSTLSRACSARILEVTPAPRQPVWGQAVTIHGAGTCMAGITPEFKFSAQVSGTTRVLCDWQTQSTCSWDTSTLPAPDYYRIALETRRSGEVATENAVSTSYAIGAVCTGASLVARPGAGPLIELEATASCDAGVTPLYRFDFRPLGGRWVTLAPFADSPVASWDATGTTGAVQLRVSIARPNHTAADVSRLIAYNLGVACTASSLAVAPGTGVREVTASASCAGSASPEYRFSVEDPDGSVSTLRDWDSRPSAAWDTSVLAGKYRVNVEVRAIENQSQVVSRRSLVVAAGAQCTVNVDMPLGVLPTNLPVPFSANTTCPSPELAFSVRPATDAHFMQVCGFSSSASCSWQPSVGALAGQYYVRVQARHSGGTLTQATSLVDFSLGGSSRCIATDQCPVDNVCVGGVATRVCIEPTLRCAEGQVCPGGMYCDAGICNAAPAAGEPCASGRRCAIGAYCEADGMCRSSIEHSGLCSPDYPPEQCVAGTSCRTSDVGTLRCLAPGETFGCNFDGDCTPDKFCGLKLCTPYRALGQFPCYSSENPDSLRCQSGLYCKNDGSRGGTCATLPGIGAACVKAGGKWGNYPICAPGTACVANICRPVASYGEDCSKLPCEHGLSCVTGSSNGACFLGGQSCGAGYVSNGNACVDLDECATGTDDCGVHATCSNTLGGFTCACKPGYSGDGKTCIDVDECATGANNCHFPHATCTNIEGGFNCGCETGYAQDGLSCRDIDECRFHQDNCAPPSSCTNTDGGFTCICPSGYRGTGVTCTDIDECAEQLVDCGAHASCVNTPGANECVCEPGYSHPWLGDHYGPDCTCTSPEVECGGQCANLARDAKNCGACGVTCQSGQACADGKCVSPLRFLDVDASADLTCAVRGSGEITCWGVDVYGRTRPPAGTFSSVSVGEYVGCALTPEGIPSCWGYNSYGGAMPPTGTFLAISAAAASACGIRNDQTLACWGFNDFGATSAPSGKFSSLSMASNTGCGVRMDGTLACWGYNQDGQASPPAGAFTSVGPGEIVSCGVRVDGSLSCWGNRWGTGVPGLTTPPPGTFSSVSVAERHACALRTDQTVTCWGDSRDGATQAPGGTFLKVSVGGHLTSATHEHSCGLRTDGSIECWGIPDYGELTVPQ